MNYDIHVTFSSLDVPRDVLGARYGILSADERSRAARYDLPAVRDRFVAGRGWLRCLLAERLRCEPADLRFGYGPHGKPYLLDAGETGLEFNLAHSGANAVCAIVCGRAVGVDIEEIRADRETDELAQRYFAVAEWKTLATLPVEQRLEAFYRCWSRKEAFIKAIGDGLTFPLDDFEVSLRPEEPPALLFVRGDPRATSRWTLHELHGPPGFAVTVAVDGPGQVVVQQSKQGGLR